MNIVFLDIDGVLNSDLSERKDGPRICGYTGIESNLVKKLRTIIESTNSKIVLVSSWKEAYETFIQYKNKIIDAYYSLEDIAIGKYLYNKLSKEHLHILDTTLKYEWNPYTRGLGIVKYIEYYNSTHIEKVNNFVIIDDEFFDDYCEYDLVNYVIKTSPAIGLSDLNVYKAIALLNSK